MRQQQRKLALAMGYRIRDANPDDFDALMTFIDAELRRDYFIPREQLRQVLGGRYHTCLIAVEDGRVLGVAIVTKARRQLVNLLVAGCERNRGLGSALLSRSRAELVRAKIDVSDGDPRDFYCSRGYMRTGEFNKRRNIELLVVNLKSPPRRF